MHQPNRENETLDGLLTGKACCESPQALHQNSQTLLRSLSVVQSVAKKNFASSYAKAAPAVANHMNYLSRFASIALLHPTPTEKSKPLATDER